jgi:nitroreductase
MCRNLRTLAYENALNGLRAKIAKDIMIRFVLRSIMSLIDDILSRRSIRRYEAKDVSEEVLRQILEAGRQAPSAANRQPIYFVIVKDHDILKILCDTLLTRFVKYAPLAIVGCADIKSLLTGKWAVVDATIAMQNMVIAAWILGVGSCWIGACNEEKVKELLRIPKKWKIVALITFGYPAEQPKPRKKKPFEELFSFNSF